MQHEPLHDGEVFERAMEYIDKQSQQPASDQNAAGGSTENQANQHDAATPDEARSAGTSGERTKPPESSRNGSSPGGSQDAGQPEATPSAPSSTGSQDASMGSNEPGEQNQSGTDGNASGSQTQPQDGAHGDEESSSSTGEQQGTKAQQESPQAGTSPTESQDQGSGAGGHGSGSQPVPGSQSAGSSDTSGSSPSATGKSGTSESNGNSQPSGTQSGGRMPKGDNTPGSAIGNNPSQAKGQDDSASGETGKPGSDGTASDQESAQGASSTPEAGSDNRANDQSSAARSDQGSARQPGGASTRSGGGGSGRYGQISGTGSTDVPEGDQANLDYARKATDLVLERLRDQRDKPDPELLKRLHWSPQDLRDFLARWEDLKKAAREEKGDAESDLEDALRSLGLRPVAPRQAATPQRDDSVHGMRDTGERSRPPAEFRDLFNAYRKAAARGQR